MSNSYTLSHNNSNPTIISSPPPDLQSLLTRKRTLEGELKKIEKQIFSLETKYLDETNHVGNILKGWDSYMSNKISNSSSGSNPSRKRFKESDRLFSQSSVTSFLTDNWNEENNWENSYTEPKIAKQKSKKYPGRPKKKALSTSSSSEDEESD